ncbi:MAG: hypothetical protein JWL81_181 [Verrucomicrobiales bacterium]|nr:hypothetical protein [Verrucomicrobiales bacterium]
MPRSSISERIQELPLPFRLRYEQPERLQKWIVQTEGERQVWLDTLNKTPMGDLKYWTIIDEKIERIPFPAD